MQKSLNLGLILVLSATACAPVSSSVLKQPPQVDKVIDATGSEEPKVKIATEKEYSSLDKTIGADYTPFVIKESDSEFSEFRENGGITDLTLGDGRLEIVVVLVVAPGTKVKDTDKVKLDMMSGKRNGLKKYAFWISKEGTSEATRSLIQKSVTKIVFLHRPAKK